MPLTILPAPPPGFKKTRGALDLWHSAPLLEIVPLSALSGPSVLAEVLKSAKLSSSK